MIRRTPGGPLVSVIAWAMLTAATPAVLSAQGGRFLVSRPAPEMGVRAGYNWYRKAPGLGAALRVPLLNVVEFIADGDYYFRRGEKAWQAALNLAVRTGYQRMLYAGAGAALVHRVFVTGTGTANIEATKYGTNLFIGVATARLSGDRLRPYLEIRWTFVDSYHAEAQTLFGVDIWFGRRR
jgi:hypothetical protein